MPIEPEEEVGLEELGIPIDPEEEVGLDIPVELEEEVGIDIELPEDPSGTESQS